MDGLTLFHLNYAEKLVIPVCPGAFAYLQGHLKVAHMPEQQVNYSELSR